MPAKAKVTKEMIIDAAFAIAREAGVENINARTVSERLHCSTQPVMYHFATMEELKRTVYAKADLYHSEYLMTMKKPPKSAALGIGMNYIRFAIEEPHLFRFLFQSDYFNGKTLLELIDAEELTPVLSAMQRSLGIGMEQTKTVFITVFLFAHGYASIIANNALKYDEDTINSHLERAYIGLAAYQGMNCYDPRFGEAFYTDSFHNGIAHEDLLRSVHCKTLFLKAKTAIGQDGLLMAALSEDDLQRVLELVPNCSFVRFNCGHAIHIEKPKEFVSALIAM